ncbi:eukaryotic translation initiation factor 4G-like isoform X2 [Magnolia sinica]|uniref:eukaryotic translation initiation factor 4G-like isoform X2 n=1 Tax=Magnolia sinica TaxID=86752 RepID=UPI00265AF7DF|nr:eukaryotic translation initiation factor 4G-like isoform X2 [Magnolia sinica]
MSLNQSRAEKSEAQLRKPGRSGSSSHQRSFVGGGGKGGGVTAPPVSSSPSPSSLTNRSFKKSSNGQGGQSRAGSTTANSESSIVVAASRTVQNGAHVQSQFHGASDAPVLGVTKPVDSAVLKGSRVLPRAPSSQFTTGALNSTAVPATPSKGDVPRPFLQFGSISPGFMNGMQIPARTTSAPPNLDEQKRDQARHDSFVAVPTLPIPSSPMQPQQMKDVSSIKQSNTAVSHPPTQPRRDVHVQIPAPPATSAPKSSVLPMTGVSMPMPFQQPQVPLQFGGPSPQIQSQGITASSLQMPLPLPMGNASQVQQQVFVPNLQSHQLQPQGMMHQGQNLGFAHQLGHQLAPQLGNLGVGVASQFGQPQAGKFGGPRRTVKITHPETHEELRLDDKRTETYMDASSTGPRSHSNIPPQSQPISSFSPAHSMNYYSPIGPIQPNSYNPPIFFSAPTSLPLTSTQMTPATSASRYNYPVGQGGQTLSFMNPSALNPLPISKAGPQMHGISEAANSEHARDGHARPVSAQAASVRVTIKPAVGSLAEKAGTTSVAVSSHASKGDPPKSLRQLSEVSVSHQQRSSDIGSESNTQQPKPLAESSDAIALHATAKHSTPTSAAVLIPSQPPSTSTPVPVTPAEDSASATTNAEGRRRETIRRSDSLKDQQKRAGKKEQRHSQQQHQADVSDSTGSLKSSSVKISKDSSSSDLNSSQGSKNTDIVQTPSEVVGASSASSALPSPSLVHGVSSCEGMSETEEGKAIPLTSETSKDILAAATEVPEDVHMGNYYSSKTVTDGVEVGEGGPCEPSNPSSPELDVTAPENLDSAHHMKQIDCSPPEVGLKQEITGTVIHTGSTISESSEGGWRTELVSQKEAAGDNVLGTNAVGELSCIKTEQKDINLEAEGCSLDVDRMVDNIVTSATTSSGPIDAESAPSSRISSTDGHGDKSSGDPSEMKSEKSIASQEVVVTDSGLSHQETAPVLSSLPLEMTAKLEGRGTESTSSSQVSTSLSGSKDRISSSEQNRTKSTAGKKKKRREILLKADLAGTTADLYMAYKGPEEKQETPLSSENMDSSAGDAKQESAGDAEKDVVATEDDGHSKSELDDWEDAVDVSTPKLKASENGEQVHGARKHTDGYGSEASGKKKYSRDFLFTFQEQCTDLPAGFEIGSDVVDALMSGPVAISHLVDRESYPNSGRIVDRPTGGSRVDRRGGGLVDGDKWSKAPGPFAAGHDPRLDLGHGGVAVNFRPGQGGNHGVLRNPRGQPGQYIGGILLGPMQSLASPGGMLRNSPDADRWQRATGTQKGLIPSPQTPLQAMHKAEKKYEVGKVSDNEEAKQRQLKAILNKLTPQNFEKLFEQVKAVNIDNVVTLTGVISQIFDKALTEPTFCEMYANFCYHLAGELPDFNEDNEKITFKRLLLNKCQEEFERGEREQAEANRVEEGEIKQSKEQREEKKVQARRRMLGNIRLIGELYKKKMLTERIMHECIQKLLGQNQNPDEEDVEALCKLMSTIGEMIDHPKAKEHMDAYFVVMRNLSNNQNMSSRVRFMLKDSIDLRKNRWQQRRKVEGPKKIEDVHRDAAQERQAQASRLSRGSGFSSSARRGQPIDYNQRGPTMLSSPSTQQTGGLRGLPPQARGYGNQDVRSEDRHPLESRALSVPLPQRPDDDFITLGPQGGLARGMSIRGQPLMSNAPLADVSSNAGEPRRMALGPNGYGPASDWTPHNSREELAPRYITDRFMAAPAYDQSNSLGHNISIGNRDIRNADHPFDRSTATSPATGRAQVSSAATPQSVPSDSTVPEERLRDMSIAAIREFYSARNEEEVRLCIKDLKTPSFYPDMVMLWVTDSFDRKNEVDRELLAKLLVNLSKSGERLLSQVQLIKGFESVLSTLEDAITDSPKAAEYLGRILGKVISEDILPLREIGQLIHNGGDEPGSLLESGLAADVLVSILDIIRKEKGDSVLHEIRTSSNLLLENFRPPDPIKSSKLDAFI